MTLGQGLLFSLACGIVAAGLELLLLAVIHYLGGSRWRNSK